MVELGRRRLTWERCARKRSTDCLISLSSTVEALRDGDAVAVAVAVAFEMPGVIRAFPEYIASSCLGVAVVRTYSFARGGDALVAAMGVRSDLLPSFGATSGCTRAAAEAALVGVAVTDLVGELTELCDGELARLSIE